jgi:hypothetical protein
MTASPLRRFPKRYFRGGYARKAVPTDEHYLAVGVCIVTPSVTRAAGSRQQREAHFTKLHDDLLARE